MPAQTRSTKITVTVGTTVAAARPPSIITGDELWAVHFADGDAGSLTDMTAPSGWQPMDSSADGILVKVWRKAGSSAEPATQAFGQPNGVGAVILSAVSGASASVTPVVEIAVTSGLSSSSPNLAPAASSHLELRAVGVLAPGLAFTFAGPSGYPLGAQDTGGDDLIASVAVASKQINSSTSSGAKSFSRTPAGFSVGTAGVSISIASADLEPTPDPPPPFTPAQGEGQYQYVVRRLLDRAYLGHLTGLQDVSFERRISTAGTFTGKVPITNTAIGDQIDAIIPRDPAELTRGPGVISVEIIREGEYWGEYWITGAVISKDRRQPPVLELRGSSLEAYLQHVRLRDDLEFPGFDQIEIARQLLTHMEAQTGADLGLVLQSGLSGQVRDRTYKGSDRTPYGQRLAELGDVLGGFEWTIDTVAGASGMDRAWRWGAPTLGDPNASHVFGEGNYGGDVLGWRIEIDALKGGTHWEARGDTPESEGDASVAAERLSSTVHAAAAHMAAGWPRIDRVIDRPGVVLQQTLEDYAAGWAARKSGSVRVFSVTVAIGADPSFTPNDLGNPARFAMSDEWHKRTGSGAGLNARYRVIGVRVTPVQRNQGKDEMELIIESSEVA